MNLAQLKKKLKVKITPRDKVEALLDDVMSGVYGTKNRVSLILILEDLKKDL